MLNRCKVAANSVVGAHALLPEGKYYPEKSLILGVPARVVRELSDEDTKTLPLAATHYVENARRYAQGLKEIG